MLTCVYVIFKKHTTKIAFETSFNADFISETESCLPLTQLAISSIDSLFQNQVHYVVHYYRRRARTLDSNFDSFGLERARKSTSDVRT